MRRSHLTLELPSHPGSSSRAGVPVAGHQGVAVLRVDDHRVVERLLHRDAAAHHRGVLSLGEEPRGVGVRADLPEHRRQQDPGPLGLAREPAHHLRQGLRPAPPEVARALEEADPRRGRETLQIGQREEGRAVDQPVDEELVAVRVDRGHPAVVPLEVQIRGRDGAPQMLQGRARRRRAGVAPRGHERGALPDLVRTGPGAPGGVDGLLRGRRHRRRAHRAGGSREHFPAGQADPPRSRGVYRSFPVRHGSATPFVRRRFEAGLRRTGHKPGTVFRYYDALRRQPAGWRGEAWKPVAMPRVPRPANAACGRLRLPPGQKCGSPAAQAPGQESAP